VQAIRTQPDDLGAPDAGNADETEENYIYETAATTLQRRLELAGYTRSTLESEFADAVAQRLEYAEEYDARHDDCRHHIPVLQSDSLDDWLGKLKQVIEQQLRADHWNSGPPTGDLLMDMLLRPTPYIEHEA